MDSLMQIQTMVQQLAEAASAALKLDVEIYDRRARIAGTGKASALIGRPIIPDGVICRYMFSELAQKKLIVENPGKSDQCRPCSLNGICHYKRAVYAAICLEERIIGVIGVVAETETQARMIEHNDYAMLEFVDKIANLISTKVKEYRIMKQLETYAELMDTIINNINKGVVVMNKDNRIVDINSYLTSRLYINKKNVQDKHIHELFPTMVLHADRPKSSRQDYQEVTCTINNKQIYFLCTLKPIVVKEEFEGSICLVEDFKDTTQMAYAVASRQNDITLEDIVGLDPGFVLFKDKVKNVAVNESTVLLTGETGTGKELFARAIHCESRRKNQPFIAINCGAIPESLIESELFGYEKGAFTGASSMGKHGKFYLANRGTIFLDEIETMPLYLQPKLLRVIERKEIERVGGVKSIPVDIRIVAATNVRLDELVEKKQFREDLYHRLNVVTLFIPPLRQRGQDVLMLANYFIGKYAQRFGKHILGLSAEVRDIFLKYEWKGNVRELQNAIEYSINMEKSEYITAENLPFQFKPEKKSGKISLDEIEKRLIKEALDHFDWTEKGRIAAAEHLGISRATIYRKIKKYQLESE